MQGDSLWCTASTVPVFRDDYDRFDPARPGSFAGCVQPGNVHFVMNGEMKWGNSKFQSYFFFRTSISSSSSAVERLIELEERGPSSSSPSSDFFSAAC